MAKVHMTPTAGELNPEYIVNNGERASRLVKMVKLDDIDPIFGKEKIAKLAGTMKESRYKALKDKMEQP